jgi:hypothetical protein
MLGTTVASVLQAHYSSRATPDLSTGLLTKYGLPSYTGDTVSPFVLVYTLQKGSQLDGSVVGLSSPFMVARSAISEGHT